MERNPYLTEAYRQSGWSAGDSRLACRKADFFLAAASTRAATTRAPSAGVMAVLHALVTAATAASTDSLPSHILPGTYTCPLDSNDGAPVYDGV